MKKLGSSWLELTRNRKNRLNKYDPLDYVQEKSNYAIFEFRSGTLNKIFLYQSFNFMEAKITEPMVANV